MWIAVGLFDITKGGKSMFFNMEVTESDLNTEGPKNVLNFLMTLWKMSLACDHVE